MTYSWAAAQEQQRSSDDIANAAFWPPLNMANFCQQYAVPAELDNAMISNALILAAAETNRRLSGFKSTSEAAGYTRLAEVDGHTIGASSVLVVLYQTAVYSAAMADLLSRRPMQADDDRNEVADQYAAQSTAAIANISGESATGVYLI